MKNNRIIYTKEKEGIQKMGFNESQKQAILHGTQEGDEALLVVSSAGSGKSRTLIGKAVKMVQDGKRNIGAISFTNNTATDLTDKLSAYGISSYVDSGTFHNICGKILRKEGYYTLSKRLKIFDIENKFKKIILDKKKIDMDDIMGFISFQKNDMKTPSDKFTEKESIYSEKQLRECFKVYEEFKTEQQAYDLDDYLLLGYEVMLKNPDKYTYDYLLVDEAQDSNEIQWKLIDLLCPSGKISIFGDAQQCMYGFRGSKPELFMDFYKTHNTKIINMNINYRSNIEIVERSNHFIKQYYGDYEYYKDAIPNSTDKAVIELMVNDTVEQESFEVVDKIQSLLGLGYKGNEIAVLYRNNTQGQYVENELKTRGIDYFTEKNGSFFDRKEIDIIMCVLRLIDNKHDDSAYETLFRYRVEPFTFVPNTVLDDIIRYSGENSISHIDASGYIHCMPRQQQSLRAFKIGIQKLIAQHNNGYTLLQLIENIMTTFKMVDYLKNQYPNIEDVKERLASLENLKKFIRSNTLDSFLKFVYETNTGATKENSEDKVQLMTIHKAKGLQWRAVIVVGLQSEKFPSKRSAIEEECNVFYVATTRPVENLYISQIGRWNQFCEEYFGDDYAQFIEEAS